MLFTHFLIFIIISLVGRGSTKCTDGFGETSDGTKCFIGFEESYDFASAQSFCEDMSMSLPLVRSPEEQGHLEDYATFFNLFWVGIKVKLSTSPAGRVTINETYWVDGSHYNVTQWDVDLFDGQLGHDYYCAEVHISDGPDVVWVPRECNLTSLSVVCERDASLEESSTTINIGTSNQYIYSGTIEEPPIESTTESTVAEINSGLLFNETHSTNGSIEYEPHSGPTLEPTTISSVLLFFILLSRRSPYPLGHLLFAFAAFLFLVLICQIISGLVYLCVKERKRRLSLDKGSCEVATDMSLHYIEGTNKLAPVSPNTFIIRI